ncbi:DUF1918 domain-containing protein [Actinoplanes sp. NPDC051851]|uniref:DUF1918 domain-containing protein n=1 Tax=Actinoplanes sp. NPDC051851 TaxID=3154753 RepID=UPI00344A4D58
MKAQTGDRIVIEGGPAGTRRRVGLIVGVGHADGSPPYQVHWLDDDRTTLLFPGPETHVESRHDDPVPTA